jgi:hypothetical protein
MTINAVLLVGGWFAVFSAAVAVAIYRWRIPGRYLREGLYSNDPRRFILPAKLAQYRLLMRLYGISFFAWVATLLAWAASRD